MAGTEYFGESTVQPRDHIPVNTTELWEGEKKGSGGVGVRKIVILSRQAKKIRHKQKTQ